MSYNHIMSRKLATIVIIWMTILWHQCSADRLKCHVVKKVPAEEPTVVPEDGSDKSPCSWRWCHWFSSECSGCGVRCSGHQVSSQRSGCPLVLAGPSGTQLWLTARTHKHNSGHMKSRAAHIRLWSPQRTYSQTQQQIVAHADLNVEAEQCVHAVQLQLVHQLSVQLVLHERQQVGDGRGVHFTLGLLLQPTQSEGTSAQPVDTDSGVLRPTRFTNCTNYTPTIFSPTTHLNAFFWLVQILLSSFFIDYPWQTLKLWPVICSIRGQNSCRGGGGGGRGGDSPGCYVQLLGGKGGGGRGRWWGGGPPTRLLSNAHLISVAPL